MPITIGNWTVTRRFGHRRHVWFFCGPRLLWDIEPESDAEWTLGKAVEFAARLNEVCR